MLLWVVGAAASVPFVSVLLVRVLGLRLAALAALAAAVAFYINYEPEPLKRCKEEFCSKCTQKSCSKKELKTCWYKESLKNHPDKGGDPDTQVRLNKCKEVWGI